MSRNIVDQKCPKILSYKNVTKYCCPKMSQNIFSSKTIEKVVDQKCPKIFLFKIYQKYCCPKRSNIFQNIVDKKMSQNIVVHYLLIPSFSLASPSLSTCSRIPDLQFLQLKMASLSLLQSVEKFKNFEKLWKSLKMASISLLHHSLLHCCNAIVTVLML